MSNNFNNLIIVLLAYSVILLLLSKLSNKKSEKFTDPRDIDNKGESEDDPEHIRSSEEENNNTHISESNKELIITGINQSSTIDSNTNFKDSQKIYSNISSRMLTNNTKQKSKHINKPKQNNNSIHHQLNEEEEFRRYLSGEKKEEEYNKQELTDDEEDKVQPYAEEEMSKFIISEEEENRHTMTEEENNRYQRVIQEEELLKRNYQFQEEEERSKQTFDEESEECQTVIESDEVISSLTEEGQSEIEEKTVKISSEIMDKKSKNDMKKRLKYQVKCGTFINPEYTKRISGCASKSFMKLHKPINEKLNKLRSDHADDTPKAIRDVYNEVVPDYKKSETSDLTCQHVQKGVSMKPCSNKFSVIGEEASDLVDNIFANDSCFDPYSNF